MADLTAVWKLAEAWDRGRPQSVELAGCRAQLYLGAMEIPLVAFRPRPHVQPRDARMQAWRPVLASLGLVLDPVETDQNYKINRGDTNEKRERQQQMHQLEYLDYAIGRTSIEIVDV